MSSDFWIILTACMVATLNAVLGSFLVLRRMAMIGDAISHAVLPGIVVAYFLAQSRFTLPMLLGAAATGLLVTYLIEFLNKKVRLQSDAAIGISFTFLFAVGVILISFFGSNVDLDQECVLYGEIAYVPMYTMTIGGIGLGPRQVWITGTVLLVTVAAVVWAYKRLELTTFDPEFAASVGINVGLWHFYLMGGVSLSTVVSFESVGAVLVIALLVGPPATAYLLTTRLKTMIMLAVLFGITSSVLGYLLAIQINGSIAGAIATVIGVQFALAFVYVLVAKRLRGRQFETPEAGLR